MAQKVKISDLITEVLFHILFLPFFYIVYRIRGFNHTDSIERYKTFFNAQSDFVIFIILFVVISFLVVLIDAIRT